jgi:hypothetical protein
MIVFLLGQVELTYSNTPFIQTPIIRTCFQNTKYFKNQVPLVKLRLHFLTLSLSAARFCEIDNLLYQIHWPHQRPGTDRDAAVTKVNCMKLFLLTVRLFIWPAAHLINEESVVAFSKKLSLKVCCYMLCNITCTFLKTFPFPHKKCINTLHVLHALQGNERFLVIQ